MSKLPDPAWIEKICLREFLYFIHRHRRYFITFIAIYLYSLFAWRRTRLLRASHCLAQHIDDILDGDREVDIPPLAYVDELLYQVETGNYSLNSPISALACYVFNEAELQSTVDKNIRAELLSLFKTLRVDRQRFEACQPLPKEQLDKQHHRTFIHAINISLMITGSRLRASDVPEMVGALSWVSPMRDLREDLQRGLINIPLEVVAQAQNEGASSLNYDDLITTRTLRDWIRQEFQRGQASLNAIPARLRMLWPKRGTLEIWAFYMEIKRYAARYARNHRDILESSWND
ncbi:MAG TPA: hypothetical protein VN653_04085 [Anaerolineales bacterium]|nr:hypothetical protein [Anaerolineales bacterium]